MIENDHYRASDLRFKQMHSIRKFENKQAVCSAQLQPESYVIINLEYHCNIN